MKLTARLFSETVLVSLACTAAAPARAAEATSPSGVALASLQSTAGELSLPDQGQLPPLESSDLTLPNIGEDLDSGTSELTLPGRAGPDPLLARQRGGDRIRELKPRGVTVMNRGRPDFDPVGIRTGGFTVFPALSAGVAATTSAVPGGSSEDLAGTLEASAVARSNWARHALAVDGFLAHNSFLTYSSQDSTSWLARARGRLDVDRTDSITAEVANERVVEARGAVGELVRTGRPVRYIRTSAELNAQGSRGRLNALFRLAYRDQNFDNRNTVNGAVIDQGRRDNERYEATVELGYQPDMPRTVFFSATRSWREYRIETNPSRDSREWEFLVGVKGEITPLLRGRFAVGYLAIDFDNPLFASKHAPSFDAQVEYLVTELTTINARARRYTRSVSSPTAPEVLATTLSVGADHEFLRNLILSATVLYQNADYFDSSAHDNLVGGELEARWLINRRWRANVHFGSLHRVAHGPLDGEDRYNAATLSAGLTFQL